MSVELFPLLHEGQSDDEQFEVARNVKRFVYDDFVRVGMPEKQVRREIGDPTDDRQIQQQLHRMHSAAPGVEYLGDRSSGLQKCSVSREPNSRIMLKVEIGGYLVWPLIC